MGECSSYPLVIVLINYLVMSSQIRLEVILSTFELIKIRT